MKLGYQFFSQVAGRMARAVSERGDRLCVDCRHCQVDDNGNFWCDGRPAERSLLTGEMWKGLPTDCAHERSDRGDCQASGRRWEPKEQ